MTTPLHAREYARRAPLLLRAIELGMREGDHRVAFTLLARLDRDTNAETIVDVAAIPPCAVSDYARWMSPAGESLLPLDRHAGRHDGTASHDARGLDDMFLWWDRASMPAWCVPLLLHARRRYYAANARGNAWTGTAADLPPVMRPGEPDEEES